MSAVGIRVEGLRNTIIVASTVTQGRRRIGQSNKSITAMSLAIAPVHAVADVQKQV
jgi:hypothetical protein